ncbi:hypothetical protein KRMM14A1004_44540 [Krasilnikovia sp. MM14-A1004]
MQSSAPARRAGRRGDSHPRWVMTPAADWKRIGKRCTLATPDAAVHVGRKATKGRLDGTREEM